uniref:Reverse transcriptase domain-containing protein n=1 Tax=Tanacetum cinerariifolium TaxID=118510 RepID=A0A6L2L585_TANCI|nr:hypothetical protein [Tanacetum cinerariifolium]
MANIIPPDHVDGLPVVEPNQTDVVHVIPEPILVDEDEDPEKEKFEEEKEPQEEEDDMEVDIEEDENEPELTYPYEEVDPLNPSPPASESETKDVIEVEDTVEPEDETIPASVHELILDLGNKVQSSVEEGTDVMENLVRKLGNTEERADCKKLKRELEEARFCNTLLRMQNERVERDLYWTRVRAHEFYREMIHRGFMFEERPNEAIDVSVEDEKTRHANAENDARGSGPVWGQDAAPAVRECTFAGFMKCNPIVFCSTACAVELQRRFKKTESAFGINECVEGKKVKFAAATLQGPSLTWWNSKVATMGLETVNRMPWTEMK